METDKKFQELREEADKRSKEADKRLDRLERLVEASTKNINGISNSNGEFAEDYFFNVFEQDPTLGNIHFDRVGKNMGKERSEGGNDEYDVVLYNDKSIAIIETKYKARDIDLEKVLRKADTFRLKYPEYAKHKIYLGLASLNFRVRTVIGQARKRGVAVIRQRGGKIVVNTENLRAY